MLINVAQATNIANVIINVIFNAFINSPYFASSSPGEPFAPQGESLTGELYKRRTVVILKAVIF